MSNVNLTDFDRIDWIDFVDIITLVEQFFNPCIGCIVAQEQDEFITKVSRKNVQLPNYLNSLLKGALPNSETTVAHPISNSDNHLLTDQIKFFAAEPLVSSTGEHYGFLCVYNLSTYDFSYAKHGLLKIIGRQIVHLIELKLTQKQGQLYLIELSKRDESLRRIALMQSHEIRHPLAAIIGLINLVKEGIHELDETWMQMMLDVAQVLDAKIKAIVNEATGVADIKHLEFNRIVEEIEDYAILLLDKTGAIENWNKGAEKNEGIY